MTDAVTRAASQAEAEAAIAAQQARVIEENDQAVIAADQVLAESLTNEYDKVLQEVKALEERKSVLRELILAMIDEGGEDKMELVVGTQVRAKRTVEPRTYLDTEELKRRYPQSRYPQFYRTTETEVLRMVKPKAEKPKGRRRG